MTKIMDDVEGSQISLDQLNIGIEAYLEKKTGICKLKLEEKKPADRHTVLTWEQRNCCLLPDDLKSFYLTSNGFDFTWCVKMDNQSAPIGKMHINPIEDLTRVDVAYEKQTFNTPSLGDLETESDSEDTPTSKDKPSLLGPNRVYELDHTDGYGKVCLTYKDTKTGMSEPTVEIWFLDRSLRWHFLSSSFLEYYRLMLMHLGLPQWHYAFTDIGLCPQAKQWFNMYAPIRLEVDGEIKEVETKSSFSKDSTGSKCTLDTNKVFKSRDRKKPTASTTQVTNQNQVPGGKKKALVSSARSHASFTSKLSQSSTQGSGKIQK